MATMPEKMSEKDICELTDKIATSYMQGKACTSAEFIETFLDLRDAAIAMINVREEKKIASYHNGMKVSSFDEVIEETSGKNSIMFR